jgi:threonine/homoserine/homoserine lactone efflux protein
MLPTHHLLPFLLTVYVLILIPGPSVLFVVSRGVSLGRRAALATVVGNASGFALQLLLVSIGVGSLVARSDAVFTTLKLLGAAYLVFLGLRNIRDRKLTPFGLVAPTRNPSRTIRRSGFGATRTSGANSAVGAICIVIALLSDGAWAIASGTAREWLGRSSRRLEWMTAGGGVTLIALGFGLALTSRRS